MGERDQSKETMEMTNKDKDDQGADAAAVDSARSASESDQLSHAAIIECDQCGLNQSQWELPLVVGATCPRHYLDDDSCDGLIREIRIAPTKGPWEVGETDRSEQRQVIGPDGQLIAVVSHSCLRSCLPEMEANAEFIVRACNAHDNLVSVLKLLRGYILNATIDLQTGTKKQTTLDTLRGGLKVLEAAIAKAEGK